MKVISFVSPKGGVGKTTAATVLATQLAQHASVVVIDADHNAPIASWAARRGEPLKNFDVVREVDHRTILDEIEEAKGRARFVIIDCEGVASLTNVYAMGASDLVIIPTQGSHLDAELAAEALKLVADAGRTSRRELPHAILLTRTTALNPRSLTAVRQELQQSGAHIFRTEMTERDAFRAMFAYSATLEELTPEVTNAPEKARANAHALVEEVVDYLKQTALKRKEGEAA